MKNIFLVLALLYANLVYTFAQNDSVKFPLHLSEDDAFVIAEYKTIYYDTVSYFDGQNEIVNKIPNNLSFQSFNIVLKTEHNVHGIVDLNYLYLDKYSDADTNSGRLYYFISEKTAPENRHNIVERKEIGRYFELSSIDNIEFGYWKRIPGKDLIVIIFRNKVKVKSMEGFRIFSGIIGKDGLYITHAMNPKDDYLFGNKFKRILDKNIDIRLPIKFSNIFHSNKVKIISEHGDPICEEISVKYWRKADFDRAFNKCYPLFIQDSTDGERFSKMKYNQGITSDFKSLSIKPIYSGIFKTKIKRFLLKSINRDGYVDYNVIKTKNKYGYFEENESDESIFMNIQLQQKNTIEIEIRYPK